jgi:hypothetical protein
MLSLIFFVTCVAAAMWFGARFPAPVLGAFDLAKEKTVAGLVWLRDRFRSY